MLIPGQCRPKGGFTLIEVTVVLVLLAIVTSTALAPMHAWVKAMRTRSALNRIGAEIYRARLLAVRDGRDARLIVHANSGGCVSSLRVLTGDATAATGSLEVEGICVRHSGDSIMWFNSRGMLRPPARSFFASHGSNQDSLIVSIAGRVRRSYRRRRTRKILPPTANSSSAEAGGDAENPHECLMIRSVWFFPMPGAHEQWNETEGSRPGRFLPDRDSRRAGADHPDHVLRRSVDERLRRSNEDPASSGSACRGHRLFATDGGAAGAPYRCRHPGRRDLFNPGAR